jgi:tRNA (cmo5U34)-methyltransferase
MAEDSLYANPLNEIVDFSFDENVARVFPDMIKRSVPGYSTLINMIGVLAAEYAQADSHLYDLGCSLGAATLAMRQNLAKHNCRIIAVDNSAAMLGQAREMIGRDPHPSPVEFIEADIQQLPMERASMVVMNLTLQFIPQQQRQALIQHIYDAMLPGGVLVLSEKIATEDGAQDALFIELHHAFKRANGYSDLEISQKRSALENVMIPESIDEHLQRLNKVGFSRVEKWFQCLNFVSFLALK